MVQRELVPSTGDKVAKTDGVTMEAGDEDGASTYSHAAMK